MAKTSGLGATVTVDNAAAAAKDISNDVSNFQFSTPRAVQDVTGVDKSAMERILLLADFSVTLNGTFNVTADKSHDVLSSVTSSSVVRTVKIQPIAASVPYLSNECLFTDYQITRANSGELTWQAPGVLADGTVPTWTNS
jgi:hypothetical protein